MEDELVFAHDEVDVGFGLHVQRGGAEDGGVEPGKGFARGDVVVEDVVGGGGPAEGGPGAPLRAFAFCEGYEVLGGEVYGGLAVGLGAELGVVGVGPVIDLDEVVFVDEFGEGFAVVVADLVGGGGASGDELGEVGEEVVAAALLEFGGKCGGPVCAVGFEGVGEDGVRRGGAEGFDEGFADGFEVGGNGLFREGIEDEALGSDGGALDGLFGVGLDEEDGYAWRGGGGDGGGGAGEVEGLGAGGVEGDGAWTSAAAALRCGGRGGG